MPQLEPGYSAGSAKSCITRADHFLEVWITPEWLWLLLLQAISQVRTVYSFSGEEWTVANFSKALDKTLRFGIKVPQGQPQRPVAS